MTTSIRPAQRVARFGTTVFSEFSALALKHQAVNLGQGFPDFDGPEEIKRAAISAIERGVNQYAIGSGAEDLRRAVERHPFEHGVPVPVTVSLGVALRGPDEGFEALFKRADEALYEAKRAGRNRVVFADGP